MKQYKHFKGIYAIEGKRAIYTKSLAPGKNVYNEKIVKYDNNEYRDFNPKRSKLAAGLVKGISQTGIKPGAIVLYLGASTGTTVSHVSDIIDKEGFVFALDFAPRVVRELIFLCEERPNIAPLLEDAFHPLRYLDKVCLVDVVFQDIAQRNQVEIFLRNIDIYLKKDGFGLLCIKARSVDVTKKPKTIFKEIKRYLEDKVTIVDYKELDPYEKDHCIFVIKRLK
jgi:fibrillarin-like pre-rRNA processing protein